MVVEYGSLKNPLYLSFLVACCIGFVTLLSGCSLVFESPEDAMDRFLQAAAERDFRELEEMLEGNPEFDRDSEFMKSISKAFCSALYNGKSGYWRVKEKTVDEAADRTFMVMEIDVFPNASLRKKSRSKKAVKPKTFEITFEMQRRRLRWYIMNVDPKAVRKMLRHMDKERSLK